MPKRKNLNKKNSAGKDRHKDAIRWLQSGRLPENRIESYSKRYFVLNDFARDELMSIGFYDDLIIEEYEEISDRGTDDTVINLDVRG